MNGLNATTHKPIVQQVQQRDVYQMNQAVNNPGNCCADVAGTNTLDDNPTCVDNDADGWCQDVDCDDYHLITMRTVRRQAVRASRRSAGIRVTFGIPILALANHCRQGNALALKQAVTVHLY